MRGYTYHEAMREANAIGRLALRLAAPPPDSDFWYRPVQQGGTITGIYVGPATSLQATAVYACVNVLAQTVASLPLHVYRRGSDGSRDIAREHDVYGLIHDAPNEEQTSFEFWETEMARLCTYGNSYSRLQLEGERRKVTAILPLRPEWMTVGRSPDTGIRFYRYQEPGKEAQTYLDDEILHVPGLAFDGLRGYSPIELNRRSIEMSRAAEEYGARFFLNNATPPQYISSPHALTPESKDALLGWFMRKFGGLTGAHRLGILDNGAEIKTVPINHRDIQFLELRKFQLEEIARIYRVPLHLIQSLDRSTNNNIEHQAIDFAVHTIRPWLRRIEARLNKALFGPRERSQFYCEFNMDGLLRGDAASRAAYYTQLRNAGIITANEIRAKENMNPIQGGDELLVQGAMIPVSQAGQQQIAAGGNDK